MTKLPASAKTVIIGGGIAGCSTALHLASLGMKNIVLLEQDKVRSTSAPRTAELLGKLPPSANTARLLRNGISVLASLPKGAGMARTGGLRLASNDNRWIELQRQAGTAGAYGLEISLLSAAEAKSRWPLIQADDVAGAAFVADEGTADPSAVAEALAKAARSKGVTILEKTAATGIEVKNGKVTAVHTKKGVIKTAKVVICAGHWSREVGRMAGVNIPMATLQHQSLIVQGMANISDALPVLSDPDRQIHCRVEDGAFVISGFEEAPLFWEEPGQTDTPQPNHEQFGPLLAKAMERFHSLDGAVDRTLVNQPLAFTPDGQFIMGEAPEMDGVFVGTGFSGYGLAAAVGAGQALASWIVKGEAPCDLWPVDIKRFGRTWMDENRLRERCQEAFGRHTAIAWPTEEYRTARPYRQSPMQDDLQVQGVCFGEKAGWERANSFVDIFEGESPFDEYAFGRPSWFVSQRREHTACRERAAIFDQSSFGKFLLTGGDAEMVLSWLCANDISGAPGNITLTPMLNKRGGIECDVTVTRLSKDAFYIVTSTASAVHDFSWIRRNIPKDCAVSLIDVTSAYSVLSVMGPKARDVLSVTTRDDLSDDACPVGQMRRIHVAGAPVMALRISYVGEMGWELHIPVEFTRAVYGALWAAGQDHALGNAGYRAIESLRLEKGRRAWGSDIGPDDSPLHAGLEHYISLTTKRDFLGKSALTALKKKPVTRRLVGFTVDNPDVVLWGGEPIWRNGVLCGYLTSGGFGFTVEKAIGYGYVAADSGVDEAYVMSGTYQLGVAGQLVSATPFMQALDATYGNRTNI